MVVVVVVEGRMEIAKVEDGRDSHAGQIRLSASNARFVDAPVCLLGHCGGGGEKVIEERRRGGNGVESGIN